MPNYIKINDIVKFHEMKNARGYPLTGIVKSISVNGCDIEVFGLCGPGSETLIKDVPIHEIETVK